MSRRPGRRITRVHQAVSRSAARLDRHKLALGLLVAAVGLVMAYVAWISARGVPFQDRYEVKALIPSDSPIVKEGNAVRIAGRLAGFVRGVDPHHGSVEVRMELRPQFAPIGRDARVYVRVKSITYLTYVEIRPGDVDEPMEEGGTIPLAHSGSGVDLLEVVQLFDEDARRALSTTATNVGYGLAGRGRQLNAGIGDLASVLRVGTPQLRAITRRDGAIREAISGTDATVRGLAGRRSDDVSALVGSGSSVLGAVGRRHRELGEAIDLLRPFEDELLSTAPLADPLLEDAAALTRELRAPFAQLERALPALERLLRLGDQIRSRTSVLARFIDPVLRVAAPLLRRLRPAIASLDPFIAALRPLVRTVRPYRGDMVRAGLGLIGATSRRYPEGATAPGTVALRFSPVLTCHRARDPFPDPGETMRHSQPC
jgi:phospholipid/cholesterol/gamma-HCH transport system substrate-binding protein